MKVRIGTYTLAEDTSFHNNSYETAAWYTDVTVPAGEYPVMAEVNAEGIVDDTSVLVRLDGVCTDAYFPALLCGVPVGKETGRDRYVGRPETYFLRPYAHALAHGLLDGSEHLARYTLDDGFKAIEIHFLSTRGVPTTTAKIVTTDYRETDERVVHRLTNLMYNLGTVDAEDENNPPPDYTTGGGYRGDGTGNHPGLPKRERRRNILRAIEETKREVNARLGLKLNV